MSKNPWKVKNGQIVPDPKILNNQLASYIRNTPGKPIKRKIRPIKKYGSMWHVDVKKDESFDHAMIMFQRHLVELYMKRVPNVVVHSDTEIVIKPRVFSANAMIADVRRIFRQRDWKPLLMRVESPNYSLWTMLMPNRDQDIFEVENSYILFDEKNQTVKSGVFCIDIKDCSISDVTYGSFVFADRQRDAERIFREIENGNDRMMGFKDNGGVYASSEEGDYEIDYMMLIAVDNLLHKYGVDAAKVEYKDSWYPSYRPLEIRFFRTITTESSAYSMMKVTNVTSWMNPERNNSVCEETSDEIPALILNPLDESIPLLDLTDYEMRYITQYGDKLRVDPNDQDHYRTINLLDYLYQPRYGATLRWELPDAAGNRLYMCTTSYHIFPAKDYIRFYIVYHHSAEVVTYLQIDFDNIKHFDPVDSLVNVGCDILQRDSTKLIETWDKLKECIPDFMQNFNLIIAIIMDLIYTHIVIHDRPQRTRMVRYTPRERSEGVKHYREDPPFIVRRILKPIKEVKRLIQQSQQDNPELRNVEYTLEEWPRIGHWRRLPNSEEQIWIEPTICHRHLPLSDKEIHLKL